MNTLSHEPSARQSSWAVANQIVLSVSAFVLVYASSAFLSPTTFGNTRFVAAVLAILSLFSLPGTGTVFAQKSAELGRTGVLKLLRLQLVWGIGALVGASVFFLYYVLHAQHDLAYAFLVCGILAPVANLYQIPGFILAGLKRFRTKTFVDTLIMFCIISGCLVGAWLTRTASGTFLFYFGLQAAGTLICLSYALKQLGYRTGAPVPEFNTDEAFSKRLTVFFAPLSVLPSIEKASIFALLGAESLAIFTIAVIALEHVKTAMRNFLQYLALPYLRRDRRNLHELSYWFTFVGLLTAAAVLALVLFALYIVPRLFPAYGQAVGLGLVLILAIIPLPAQIFMFSLIAQRRIKSLYVYATSAVLITLVCQLTLVPVYGLSGAITAKIIIEYASALLLWLLVRREPRQISDRQHT